MKLFIWFNPYDVRYGGSALYVVAETEEQARELAPKGKSRAFGIGEDPAPQNINLGKPDVVLDAPCAEWYEWSE